MDNVINFNDIKSSKEIKPKQNIPKYEDLKEEIIEMINNGVKVVASDFLQAHALSKILMELDPNIRYCTFRNCVSRISQFIEVVPVIDNDSVIQFTHSMFTDSYAKHLEENDLLEFVGDGMVTIKNEE